MWVMTSFGILMPSLRPQGTVPVGDNRPLQVRARRRGDLDILRERYQPDLGRTIHLRDTDYEYRAYCTLESWQRALALISADIDYTKFKPTTETKFHDKALHQLYNSLWSVIFNKFDVGISSYSPQRLRRKARTARYPVSDESPQFVYTGETAYDDDYTEADLGGDEHTLIVGRAGERNKKFKAICTCGRYRSRPYPTRALAGQAWGEHLASVTEG